MLKQSWTIAIVLIWGVSAQLTLPAATPGQAYHRTPICADGNCVPNRATNGYHATRWRPWPEGEPTLSAPVPPVGIDLNKTEPPPRDKELELPTKPNAPSANATTEPSPNDKPNGGIVLPPELQNVTPKKPVEEPLPGNSSLQPGPLFPGSKPTPTMEPLLLGKKPMPMPLRSTSPALPSNTVPSDDPPPMLKIRAEENPQSGLMPEMIPWNDEEKNPIVRQVVRISASQVQQTISLDETNLPETSEVKPLTIRLQQETLPSQPIQTSAITGVPHENKPVSKLTVEPMVQETVMRSPNANAPAILSNIEALPLPAPQAETDSSKTAVTSPLRGLSQGNPLRR